MSRIGILLDLLEILQDFVPHSFQTKIRNTPVLEKVYAFWERGNSGVSAFISSVEGLRSALNSGPIPE